MYVLNRIKEIRKEKEISQEEISKTLGMKQTQYSRYERGENEIKVNVLIDICKALNVSADYILELTDNPEPHWEKKTKSNNVFTNSFNNINNSKIKF